MDLSEVVKQIAKLAESGRKLERQRSERERCAVELNSLEQRLAALETDPAD